MRLSRKFKDLFSKIRYTYVYRSEYAASPKELPGFGSPQVQPELGSERHEDDSSHRCGRRYPRLHQLAATN